MTQKWVNLGLLGGAFVFFLFVHRLSVFVWELARLPLMEEWPIGPPAIIAFIFSLTVTLWVRKNKKANTFLNEVVAELQKVFWPTRKETVLSTGVVMMMVGICALLLFAVDFLWGTVTRGVLAF